MSKQLLNDLQELIRAEIITPDTAQQIESYYKQKTENRPNKFATILGMLGALLVSLGIVLLIAHNWDDWGKPTKTILAFLPLAIAQVLCGFALFCKKNNVLWQESTATFLFFAIASCLALISQIYHISGTLSEFLLTWLLLSIPLVYIMSSSLVSLLCISVGTWYAAGLGYSGIFSSGYSTIPYWYVILLLLLTPHYYHYARYNRKSNFFHLHNWFLAISLIITLGSFVDPKYPFYEWIFVAYLALFNIFYLLGNSDYFRENRLFANPLVILGVLGTIVILMIWSFEPAWTNLTQPRSAFFGWFFSFLNSFLLVLNVILIYFTQRKMPLSRIDPVGFSSLIFSAALFVYMPNTGKFVVNIWLLVIGLFYIRKGTRQDHFGILNFGLLIIAALAVMRFFDDSISFVWRGLFFLVTGAGFFIANYLLLKKRKALSSKTNPL